MLTSEIVAKEIELYIKQQDQLTRYARSILPERLLSFLSFLSSSPSITTRGKEPVSVRNPSRVPSHFKREESYQVVHCRVRNTDNTWTCIVSIVYGENCPTRIETLWADLVSHASTFEGIPWMVAGDFNAIRGQIDRAGGSNDWPNWMNDFEDFFNRAELDDVRYRGQFHTWSNRRDEGPILRKLDRVLANIDWGNWFPRSEVHFLPAGVSDHLNMVVKLTELPRTRKPFKFYDFWVDHPDFLPLVEEVWKT